MGKLESYLPTFLNADIAVDDLAWIADKSNAYKTRAMTFEELDKRWATQDEIEAAANGIKYFWDDIAARNAQAGMATDEQGMMRNTAQNRTDGEVGFVYLYNGAAWVYTYTNMIDGAVFANDIVMASGKGIDYTAAGGDVLSIYKEGTWPAVATLSVPGTESSVPANNKYVKKGIEVTASCDIAFTKGTGTGNLVITGLPYTVSGGLVPGSVDISGGGRASYVVSATVSNGGVIINMRLNHQGVNAETTLTDSDLAAVITLRVSVTYFTV